VVGEIRKKGEHLRHDVKREKRDREKAKKWLEDKASLREGKETLPSGNREDGRRGCAWGKKAGKKNREKEDRNRKGTLKTSEVSFRKKKKKKKERSLYSVERGRSAKKKVSRRKLL